MADRKQFVLDEMARGPLDKETAALALAGWSGRAQLGGFNQAQCAQLMFMAATAEIVESSNSADTAVEIFNTILAQAAHMLSQRANLRFGTAGNA